MLDVLDPFASAASGSSTLPIYASLFDDGDGAQSETAILLPVQTMPGAPVVPPSPENEVSRAVAGCYDEGGCGNDPVACRNFRAGVYCHQLTASPVFA